MSLKVSTKKAQYAPIPEGTYGAICYAVVEVGQQYNKRWNKITKNVILIWEIDDDDLREDFGRNKFERRAISGEYTIAFGENSNLYNILRPWIGEELDTEIFDFETLLGRPCMLTVINKKGSDGKVYANVASVSKIMKGVNLGEAENPLTAYDFDEPDEEVFNALPEWIQKKIQESKSPNAQAANSVNVVVDESTGEVIESKVEKPAPVAKPPVSAPKAAEPTAKAEKDAKNELPKIDSIPDEGEEDYPF